MAVSIEGVINESENRPYEVGSAVYFGLVGIVVGDEPRAKFERTHVRYYQKVESGVSRISLSLTE